MTATEKFPYARSVAIQQAKNNGFPSRQCDEFEYSDYDLKLNQKRAADEISPLIPLGGTIIIRGEKGSGKTSLAASYGYGWYRRGYQRDHGKAKYWRMTGLLNQQKSWFATHQGDSPMDTAMTCGLLVLDELITTHDSAYDQNIIRELLDVRYAEKRTTILITNLDNDGLRRALDSATLDRIRDGGGLIEMKGKSLRGQR